MDFQFKGTSFGLHQEGSMSPSQVPDCVVSATTTPPSSTSLRTSPGGPLPSSEWRISWHAIPAHRAMIALTPSPLPLRSATLVRCSGRVYVTVHAGTTSLFRHYVFPLSVNTPRHRPSRSKLALTRKPCRAPSAPATASTSRQESPSNRPASTATSTGDGWLAFQIERQGCSC